MESLGPGDCKKGVHAWSRQMDALYIHAASTNNPKAANIHARNLQPNIKWVAVKEFNLSYHNWYTW